jgi:hypothetical protein
MKEMNRLDFDLDGKKYFIRLPTQRDMNEADLVYKTKYSEALRYGALSTAEALKIISERKIYNSEDDFKIKELFFKLHELGEKLLSITKFSPAAEVIFEMEKVRNEIISINMKKNNILDNTAEAYADEHRLQFYSVACTFASDGKQVFKDVDEYLERASESLAKVAITKTIHLIANGGKDFRAEWPEYRWRVKQGLMDENLNPIKENIDKFVEEANSELSVEVNKEVEQTT